MRIILKILAMPLVAILTIFGGIATFLLFISGWILGLASILVALAGLGILIMVDLWGGIAWLVIAFLISPYGLPKLAAYAIGGMQGVNYMLRDFITS